MHQLGDVHDIFVGTLHQAVLQPWYHLKKKFEYLMLPTFPSVSQSGSVTYNQCNSVILWGCFRVFNMDLVYKFIQRKLRRDQGSSQLGVYSVTNSYNLSGVWWNVAKAFIIWRCNGLLLDIGLGISSQERKGKHQEKNRSQEETEWTNFIGKKTSLGPDKCSNQEFGWVYTESRG